MIHPVIVSSYKIVYVLKIGLGASFSDIRSGETIHFVVAKFEISQQCWQLEWRV